MVARTRMPHEHRRAYGQTLWVCRSDLQFWRTLGGGSIAIGKCVRQDDELYCTAYHVEIHTYVNSTDWSDLSRSLFMTIILPVNNTSNKTAYYRYPLSICNARVQYLGCRILLRTVKKSLWQFLVFVSNKESSWLIQDVSVQILGSRCRKDQIGAGYFQEI